jgi:hypothetical protein
VVLATAAALAFIQTKPMSIYTIPSKPTPSIDALATKLASGDTIQMVRGASGTTANGLNLRDGVKMIPVGDANAALYRLNVVTTQTKLEVLRVGKGKMITAGACAIHGGYMGCSMGGGCEDITVADLEVYDPSGYCCYTGKGVGNPPKNKRITARRVKLIITAEPAGAPKSFHRGEHCWRIYWTEIFLAEQCELQHHGRYGGGTWAIKQCYDWQLIDPVVSGHSPMLGPNPYPIDPTSYECRKGRIINPKFDLDIYLNVGPQVYDLKIIGGTIKSTGRGGGIFNLPYDSVSDIELAATKLTGPASIPPFKGKKSAVSLDGVFWNGKPRPNP